MKSLGRLFSFDGVSTRKEFWLVKLGIIISVIIIFIILGSYLIYTDASDELIDKSTEITGNIFTVFAVWVELAVTARRSADLGKSRWLAALYFIPLVNLGLAIYLGFTKKKERKPNELDIIWG